MESEHFTITGARRLNRRQCAVQVRCIYFMVDKRNVRDTFEVFYPWTGPLHYADALEGHPEYQKELTELIEAYTGR